MEKYYKLIIRTGAPSGVDTRGGVHIEGYPELVYVANESVFDKLERIIKKTINRVFKTKPLSYGRDEFLVEVPADVDISAITGVDGGGSQSSLHFKRVHQMECDLPDVLCAEEFL